MSGRMKNQFYPSWTTIGGGPRTRTRKTDFSSYRQPCHAVTTSVHSVTEEDHPLQDNLDARNAKFYSRQINID